MLLRRVLLQRRDLPFDMPRLEREVRLVAEVEVVPRDLVAEDRRPLERPQPLARDRLVILVHVVHRGHEHAVGLPVAPDLDQQLEDLLPALRERAHVEVVHGEVAGRDAELGGRLAHFARQCVGREARRAETALRSRRRRSERPRRPRRAAPSSRRSRTHRRRCAARAPALAGRRQSPAGLQVRAPTATSARRPQNDGSSKSAL